MAGRLLGIARKPRPRATVETVDSVAVGLATGIDGDFRGTVKPGGRGRRQVTALLLSDWQAALADIGRDDLAWSDRRANLLIDGIELPRGKGGLLRIGDALFEITGECDPCSRMDAVAPGLRAALTPDWRGGRLLRVLAEGRIAIGSPIVLEQTLREAV